MFTYTENNQQPVPCLDVIILNEKDEILLAKRQADPYKDSWNLICRKYAVKDDSAEIALTLYTKEQTGLDITFTHLLGLLTDGHDADRRFFALQVIYVAKTQNSELPADKSELFKWFTVEDALKQKLAFNHNRIIKLYKEKKETNKLILAKRNQLTEFYDKNFSYYQNNFPRFAADAIILNDKKEILLARRVKQPYIGFWDFPGGHMHIHESVEQCLKREVWEELGVKSNIGELFHVYSDKGHTPRSADIVAYIWTEIESQDFQKNIEMGEFQYYPLDALPEKIAYHNDIALKDIKKHVDEKTKSE